MAHKFLLFVLFLALAIIACDAQQIDKLTRKCPSPLAGYSSILATQQGDLTYAPCPTRSSIFTGNVDFSGATIVGFSPLTTKGDLWGFSTTNARIPVGTNGQVLVANSAVPLGVQWATPAATGVTGSGTINFIPRWNTLTTQLADTPFSWDGTQYAWNNTALNSTFPFTYNPTSASGLFDVGANATARLLLNQSAALITLQTAGRVELGDTGGIVNGTEYVLNDASQQHTWAGNIYTFENFDHTETVAEFDAANRLTSFGDLSGGGNNTTFAVNDGTETVAGNTKYFQIEEAGQNFRFGLSTASADGFFSVGNSTDFLNYFQVNTSPTIDIRLVTPEFHISNSTGQDNGIFSDASVKLGDIGNLVSGSNLTIDNASKTFIFADNVALSTIDFFGIINFKYHRTITAGGTTGAQIINKPSGTVNFAAGATSLVVTNSTVDTSSIVYAIARTNDIVCSVRSVVPAAGSFTINMTGACNAETSVGFIVNN